MQIETKCSRNWSFRKERWFETKATPKINKKKFFFKDIWSVENMIQMTVFFKCRDYLLYSSKVSDFKVSNIP